MAGVSEEFPRGIVSGGKSAELGMDQITEGLISLDKDWRSQRSA